MDKWKGLAVGGHASVFILETHRQGLILEFVLVLDTLF